MFGRTAILRDSTDSFSTAERGARRRKAFTLVELLVVIAIIGVLVALLVAGDPGGPRSVARAPAARNNLKQIALASPTSNPPIATFRRAVRRASTSIRPRARRGSSPARFTAAAAPRCYGPNWAVQLFGFIEQGSLARFASDALKNNPEDAEEANPADNWDLKRYTYGGLGGKTTPSWLCPTQSMDPGNPSYYNDDDDGTTGMSLGHLSKGNYAACFGGRNMMQAIPLESVNPPYSANIYPRMTGMFGMVRIRKNPVGQRIGRGATSRRSRTA